MSLQTRFPNDPGLLGLLSFYKQACPGRVVIGRSLPRPTRVFSMVCPRWQLVASKMWKSWNHFTKELDATRRVGLKLGPSDAGVRFRRQKVVELSLPIGTTATPKHGQVPLYLLSSWEELLLSIDALALPDCSAAYLGDRHLQLYSMCSNTADATEGWLTHALKDATLWTDQASKSSRALSRLLVSLLSCTRRTGRLPLGVKNILGSYLVRWDGIVHQSLLFDLIAYYPPTPFKELHRDLLSPLARFSPTGSSPQLSARILGTFVCLLRRWMHEKPPAHSHLEPFAAYTTKFALMSLQLEKDHPLVVHQALAWIELVGFPCNTYLLFQLADLFPVYGVSLGSFPSISLFNRLFLTVHGAMAISRICGALAQFDAYFQSPPKRSGALGYTKLEHDAFVSVVVDFIDVLWRLNGFGSKKDGKAIRFAFGLPR